MLRGADQFPTCIGGSIVRRKGRNKVIVEAKRREELEGLHGRVWTQEEVAKVYVITSIIGNTVVVRRKDDGTVGSLDYQTGPPTLYFNWRQAPPN
jgi:hypothetical protein